MLSHIEETLLSTLHLPVSPEDTLHFYRCLHMHILIANKEFLLLTDVPIRDQSQQLPSYQIFTLDIPNGNVKSCYDINTQYLGITQDETLAVEMSHQQFSTCQEANGQFCNAITPVQLLANPPSCTTALYTKYAHSISTRCSLQIRKTQDVSIPSQLTPNIWITTTPLQPQPQPQPQGHYTHLPKRNLKNSLQYRGHFISYNYHQLAATTMPNFHLPPHYENSTLEVNFSLDMTKPKHDQHIIYEFLDMETLGEESE